MNANELVAELRRLNPGERFAASRLALSVGQWFPELGRFAAVFEWADIGTRAGWCRMPFEVLTNGEPTVKPCDWVE